MAAAYSWSPRPAPFASRPVSEFVARLASHAPVEGILALGSTGLPNQMPWADIDLFLLVYGWPSAVRVGITSIDGRLADLLFADPSALDRIRESPGPLDATTWDGRLAGGLQTGRILYDRSGQLAAAQRHLNQLAVAPIMPPPSDAYRSWFRINYNRVQTRRMVDSGDPTYLIAVDARLLYMLSEVFTAYFSVRSLNWDGEKAAIRYLRQHDEPFLAQFQTCIATMQRAERFHEYEKLAKLALAPLGPLWEEPMTVFDSDSLAETATERAREVWEVLIRQE